MPGPGFDKGLALSSFRRMPSSPDDFQHCLSSSLFLLNRDAVLRLYRPEDFGHQPLQRPILNKTIQKVLQEQLGIEVTGRS